MDCKHGCGYTNDHRGALNLHENIHCKTLKQQSPQKQGGGGGEMKSRYCDCEGEPSWSFLSRGDSAHARAISAGYKKICTECGEVI